jgi:tripartite ATP-independent transporter DctM subunit
LIALFRPDLAPPVAMEERVPVSKLLPMLLLEALPPLVLIFGILGTMLAGIATATEASAIGAFLALMIVIARGRFEWATFASALWETGRTSAMILFIVVGATAFTGVVNITGGLHAAQSLMRGLDMEPWMLITMMMLVIFVMGMFLDWTGIVLLSFPIFLPVVREMGISELWFVVLTAVVLQTSFLTPPFGYALFYMRALSPRDIKTSDIILGVMPFIALIVMMALALALFPQLITWLPDTLYKTQ